MHRPNVYRRAMGRAAVASSLRSRLTIRNLRLATGLVLFAYISSHLLNHALGNASLAAMEAALGWIAWVWNAPPMGAILYAALLVHLGLGISALYARTRFQWSFAETTQLVFGLALPPLLVTHVVGTKLANTFFGTQPEYAQILYVFWVASPWDGALQALALVVAWLHGCLGLYFWLRLKRWFPRYAPALLSLAVLLPVISLLGYVQAGRAVVALAADENWRIEYVPLSPAESPVAAEQAARLAEARRWILLGFLAAVLLALGGRLVRLLAERRRGLVRIGYPNGSVARVPRGTSVLEASRIRGVAHASVCGGRGRCSTCRVRIFGDAFDRIPAPSLSEQAVLDRVAAGPHVRLACQLRPTHDLNVAPLVALASGIAVARRPLGAHGEERFVVAMFVDMRGSTRLAERRLPFDTVFLINRFLDAVTRGVTASGGAPNQFLGDGLFALFGLASDPKAAARGALQAVADIGQEIAALNLLMAAELPAPIRFGIGVHAGTAVLGEIGAPESGHAVFTAIGDPVNVAARLQSMTKGLGCEALISDAVYEAAGLAPDMPPRTVAIDGRDAGIAARAVIRAADAAVPALAPA